MTLSQQTPARILSIDQYRGFAVVSMIVVNFAGQFDVMPWWVKHHHTGFSFADVVAPVFLFVVGMGFRLSFTRRLRENSLAAVRRKALRRYLILTGLGMVYGGFHLKAAVWDALTDIGISGLLALPFIHRGPVMRTGAALVYLGIYQALFSLTGYGGWVMAHSINGGPLGPLSWVFILLMGTVCMDLLRQYRRRGILAGCLAGGAALIGAGLFLRSAWPGMKNLWPFTQYGMSAPYPVAAAGIAFLLMAVFYVMSDVCGMQAPHLNAFGRNPLVLYLLQAALILCSRLFLPPDTGFRTVLLELAALYGVCYGVARILHGRNRIIRI
jgi:predicted acyltransferase